MLGRMTEAELAKLDDSSAPNVPAKLPGHPGPNTSVSVAEQRERRSIMSGMLSQGVDKEDIQLAFAQKFGMTDVAIRNLTKEVRGMWEDDDAESLRYAKSGARRRILRSIREANKDRKYTAVANLEKTLADIEGTNVVPEEKPLEVDSRLNDAVLAMLGASDSRSLRILVESERARMLIEVGERGEAPGVPVLAEGVETSA